MNVLGQNLVQTVRCISTSFWVILNTLNFPDEELNTNSKITDSSGIFNANSTTLFEYEFEKLHQMIVSSIKNSKSILLEYKKEVHQKFQVVNH